MNIFEHFLDVAMFEHFLTEEQLMLVFEDQVTLRHFLIAGLHQENPELFHLEEPLAQVREERRLYFVEDELVLLGRAVKGEHGTSVVVLLPENVVARQSSCLLVAVPLRE